MEPKFYFVNVVVDGRISMTVSANSEEEAADEAYNHVVSELHCRGVTDANFGVEVEDTYLTNPDDWGSE